MTAEIKDYRLKVGVKNNLLLRAMEAKGIYTAAELNRASGVSYSVVHQLLNLRLAPLTRGAGGSRENQPLKWRAPVLKLAEFFDCEPWELFPSQHFDRSLPISSGEVEVSLEEIEAFLPALAETPALPDIVIEAADLQRVIATTLDKLTSRERGVIESRFGLNGVDPKTYKEIGAEQGCGGQRIHQIAAKALRKLRHPACRQQLAVADDRAAESLGPGRWNWQDGFTNAGHGSLKS